MVTPIYSVNLSVTGITTFDLQFFDLDLLTESSDCFTRTENGALTSSPIGENSLDLDQECIRSMEDRNHTPNSGPKVVPVSDE